MSDALAKLKNFKDKVGANSFVRLALGENRKYKLRRSRGTCLTVFFWVATAMCFLYISISGAASAFSSLSPRGINAAAVNAKIEELTAEIQTLEDADISEYGAEELNTHANNLEDYRRSVEVLREVQNGNYDGKKYSVVYVDVGGNVNTFGTASWGYSALFGSFVLDFLTMLIAIFISITVATVFGAEYSEKTVKLMFTKPSTRVKLFLCKMTVVFKEMLIYSAIGFAILFVANWASNGFDLRPTLCYIGNGVRTVGVFEQLFLLLLTIVTDSAFYAVLATMFCVAAKSRVLPILCTILFSRLPEIDAIKNLMVSVSQSSINLYNCIFSNHINLTQYFAHTQLVVNGTGFTTSYLVLLVYIGAIFTASLFAFKQQRVVK